jgi:site-specific DNA-methyltransferase (adenine-specific)
VLVFVNRNSRKGKGKWISDFIVSGPNDNDKSFHKWGQSLSGMTKLIEQLTEPDDLVCDPFYGGATTAVVCWKTGRRFVGCDIDPEAVRTARQRLGLD